MRKPTHKTHTHQLPDDNPDTKLLLLHQTALQYNDRFWAVWKFVLCR
jgi:hypothetical protein